MEKEYKFVCPKCGCNILDEIAKATTSSTVASIIEDEGNTYIDSTGHTDILETNDILRYDCHKCGYAVEHKETGVYIDHYSDLPNGKGIVVKE